MNRTDRLYALVEDLRAIAPRCRSARELARRFEVSQRTIERDISALQQAGVPIYAEPGRRGGYALEKSMSLPPLNFTPAEAVAVAIALSRAEGQPFAAQARSALGKLMAAMPGAEGESARELARQVQILRPEPREDGAVVAPLAAPGGDPAASEGHTTEVARGGVPPVHRADSAPATRDFAAPDAASSAGAAGPPAIEVIETALLSRVVLRIRYADRSGTLTSREVEPGAFVGVRNGVWYLAGWCRLRNEARVFRLDRIASAVLTDEPAPWRPVDDFTSHAPESVILRPALD
ncbi:helix-turn-helix transcriptional regulator [Microtetraspora malaysiensis]|uniref:helix-turn-helix transcriptional regulator n=1 Tax=Microtetraspora malaysiensis TaxID=161358 RepID=UPI003D8D37A9